MPRRALQRLIALSVLLGTGSCREEVQPITAARRFAAAMQQRDTEALLELIDRTSAGRLARAAEQATDQIGGRRIVQSEEIVEIVDVDPRFEVASATLVESDETRATVRLDATDGTQHDLSLVFEDGAWRVQVPIPPH